MVGKIDIGSLFLPGGRTAAVVFNDVPLPALGCFAFVSPNDAPQKSEPQPDRFFGRAECRLLDGLLAILDEVAVPPAQAGDVILDPLADVEATLASDEGVRKTSPLAAHMLIGFARKDVSGTLVALMRLASTTKRAVIELWRIIITETIVTHAASITFSL
jgi:hypothetical protein